MFTVYFLYSGCFHGQIFLLCNQQTMTMTKYWSMNLEHNNNDYRKHYQDQRHVTVKWRSIIKHLGYKPLNVRRRNTPSPGEYADAGVNIDNNVDCTALDWFLSSKMRKYGSVYQLINIVNSRNREADPSRPFSSYD